VQQTYELSLPPVNVGADQDAECLELRLDDGSTRRIRFHDYAEIFSVPGLYEQLFYDLLECQSPEQVCGLLGRRLRAQGLDAGRLSVLDLGAGNGMVGECLVKLGFGELVGVDILEAAAAATQRDRPGLYDEYVVADLTEPLPPALAGRRFDCLTSVAALGFGDVPPDAFRAAYDLVEAKGWIAFCIKEDFMTDGEPSGFARLVRDLLSFGELKVLAQHRYRHRLAASGEPLHYLAIVARKER